MARAAFDMASPIFPALLKTVPATAIVLAAASSVRDHQPHFTIEHAIPCGRRRLVSIIEIHGNSPFAQAILLTVCRCIVYRIEEWSCDGQKEIARQSRARAKYRRMKTATTKSGTPSVRSAIRRARRPDTRGL